MHSRNNRCGILIGQGVSPKEAIDQVGMVVEGVNAILAALELAKRYNVEMPIVNAVDMVINHSIGPAEMASDLMGRDKKMERQKIALDIAFEHTFLSNKRGIGMKRIIAYGTFDLLHYGHINLLRRARLLVTI